MKYHLVGPIEEATCVSVPFLESVMNLMGNEPLKGQNDEA
jgi:hypothetical protein